MTNMLLSEFERLYDDYMSKRQEEEMKKALDDVSKVETHKIPRAFKVVYSDGTTKEFHNLVELVNSIEPND